MDGRYLIGYARVSTDDQELRLQIDALERYGVPSERIYTEKKSGKRLKGRMLGRMLPLLRKGDRVVVWKLDRLGRSLKDLIEITETIDAAGADLVVLTEGIDTSNAMGKFFFHIMAAIAELERGMTSDRTKAGMAARKRADPNVKWGSKHWFTDYPKRQKHVQGLYNAGEFKVVARPVGIHPKAVALDGMTPLALMEEANAADPKAKLIGSAETIRRWLRQGAPGLDFDIVEQE